MRSQVILYLFNDVILYVEQTPLGSFDNNLFSNATRNCHCSSFIVDTLGLRLLEVRVIYSVNPVDNLHALRTFITVRSNPCDLLELEALTIFIMHLVNYGWWKISCSFYSMCFKCVISTTPTATPPLSTMQSTGSFGTIRFDVKTRNTYNMHIGGMNKWKK